MKNKLIISFLLIAAALTFQSCIAIPPLIHVQHQDNNEELRSRLDSIDRRLDRLEQKAASEAK